MPLAQMVWMEQPAQPERQVCPAHPVLRVPLVCKDLRAQPAQQVLAAAQPDQQVIQVRKVQQVFKVLQALRDLRALPVQMG